MCWVIPPASPSVTLELTNRVQQRGLTVVNVTKNGDHWWTRAQLGVVVFFVQRFDFVFDVGLFLDRDFFFELLSQQFDGVFIEGQC